MLNGVGITNACHHIFTLGIEQIFTHHFLFAGGWVAGERHACPGVIAHVAKDHGHDVDRRAKVVGNAFLLAVGNGTLAVP